MKTRRKGELRLEERGKKGGKGDEGGNVWPKENVKIKKRERRDSYDRKKEERKKENKSEE